MEVSGLNELIHVTFLSLRLQGQHGRLDLKITRAGSWGGLLQNGGCDRVATLTDTLKLWLLVQDPIEDQNCQ